MTQQPHSNTIELASGSDTILILGETKDFRLEIGTLSIVPKWLKGARGYRLRNKRTSIVEQEGNSLANAIRALHANQKALDEVDADPEGKDAPKQPQTLDELLGLVDQSGIELPTDEY